MVIIRHSLGKLVTECQHSEFYWNKDNGDGGDNWSYEICKAAVKLSLPTYRHCRFWR